MAISDTKFDIRMPRMTLEDHVNLANGPRRPAHQQFWNVPAKLAHARQRRAGDPHNDELDAMRHARWSQRMTSEIDPITAFLVGGAHELEGRLRNQPRDEELMDLRNNAEGRRAALEGRPIDPRRLQLNVRGPAGVGTAYPQGAPQR
ncbi:DUF6973 domain-containing protein [Phenylobacterium sp. VNQ135]|uniref:DUF6973 domain-containing protein n=1 Tax=Phenylobacterium sp. VNQ135 TaxID=3400922 RepID=UPI003C0DFC5E